MMEGAMSAPAATSVNSRVPVSPAEALNARLAAKADAVDAPAARAPANDDATPAGRSDVVSRSRRPGRRTVILGAAAALAIMAAGYYGAQYWTTGRFMVSTDDAYVRAHTTTLAAKVPGYIAEVLASDNAPVRTGEVIACIDDGDFRIAVDAARAKVASQQAAIERIGRQVEAALAAVEQARAQLASAQAGAIRAKSEFERSQALAAKDFASKQSFDAALAARDQTAAAVSAGQAALDGAQANVEVLKAQQNEAARGLDELRTALVKAERDLAFTEIRAPIDGVIGNRAMQVGDYVQTGQRLASVVPLDNVYIDANFKETQLARLQPGQRVAIRVDALPEHAVEGVVDSVSPASGAVFSLLPPENATGNFTKIVQRVPVRIRVPQDVAGGNVLRPGLSVVVSVNTKPGTEVAAGSLGTPAGKPARTALVR
jgi:membrane fusion protein (multidrug efflux system)